ncbi:TonB family protein [Opitutus sp. GAS368]|uniref:TonB family protein n=1 Tax=Opitutus sp. GAS368 TaxID=1882749 RepID=UPI00087B0170|nr:TonB family protein [Opitutus sp. GAS368]SDS16647.1 TonB family C-terminal domain-containing protein [Opitutus sp. GAS368]
MKIKSLVIASALAGGLFCSASALTTVAPGKIANFEAPAPESVVSPTRLPASSNGSIVTLSMTIDESGRPHNIKVVSRGDQDLAPRLVSAVSQWKFKPALRNGVPVSIKVVLPLQLIEG